MNILTKTLAILLSVFSLVLAGMVVAFFGNATNYQKAYEDEKNLKAVAEAALATQTELYNTQMKKITELSNGYQQSLQNLEADNNRLSAELRRSERLAQQYQSQANSWKGLMTGFEQTVRNLQASLSETQKQLDDARTKGIKNQKELNQITADLYEKIVQLQAAEAERRRLLEQKKDLEAQVSNSIAPARTAPVTQLPRTATPVTPVAPKSGDIKGLVVEVEEGLITLSVGSADGVKPNMVFHITRGDRFMCDVIVTNVDINRSAGVLDLVQQAPQVGDTASTQL